SRKRHRAAAARAHRRRRGHPLAIDRARRPARRLRGDRRRGGGQGARDRGGARMSAGRLPLLKAAWVVARRDFTAILFSRAFIFFLLGPLFPVVVGVIAGGIGQRVESAAGMPQVALAMEARDVDRMLMAQARLAGYLG